MISEKLAELLSSQIQSELTAHMHYMAISYYFRLQSLDGWAKLFHDQSIEEAGHAKRIMDFLDDSDVQFDMPSLPGASTRFASAMEAAKSALDSERRVSGQFQTMANVALEEDDYTSFQFLQWFIDEQVEEEAKMQKVIDLIESGINLFQAELLLAGLE